MNITARHIEEAERMIRPHILETPLIHSRELSLQTGAEVFLKLENRQHTGSFKARGAMHKVLSIQARTTMDHSPPKVITASTGNHGLGVARALEITGLSGKICVPENASASKVAALKEYPVDLIAHGMDSVETELYAKQCAVDEGAAWISPYNDPEVIAGQGTIGIELTRELESARAVYVTVGGGGLISGIATWFAEHAPRTEIIACLPENSPEMKLSVDAGHIIHMENSLPTLSDGSAGGMEDGSITFPICRELVKRYILVSEDEIAEGIRMMFYTHHERIEGAAGVAVAAVLKDTGRYAGKNVVAVICGGNIDDGKFKTIML